MKNIVSTQWLVENFNTKNLVILDCRYEMNDLEYGINEYNKAHIKNASFVSLEHHMAGTKEVHGGRHPLPNMDKFSKAMTAMNVSDDSIVVIYDDYDLASAARLWWLLKYIGKDQVYVLDGGFKEWCARGLPTTDVINSPRNSNGLTVKLNHSMICNINFVKENIEKLNSVIVDSRSPERYLGIVEPIDKRAGHIKSAKNYFWQENFQNEKLKSHDMLKDRFKELQGQDNLIVHCGSGITACPNILAMNEVGLDPILYIGGWSDWVSYEDNEVISK